MYIYVYICICMRIWIYIGSLCEKKTTEIVLSLYDQCKWMIVLDFYYFTFILNYKQTVLNCMLLYFVLYSLTQIYVCKSYFIRL